MKIELIWFRREVFFKKTFRKARFRYDSDQFKTLNDLRYDNAKEYWKLLRKISNISQPTISMDNYTAYFKAIYKFNCIHIHLLYRMIHKYIV